MTIRPLYIAAAITVVLIVLGLLSSGCAAPGRIDYRKTETVRSDEGVRRTVERVNVVNPKDASGPASLTLENVTATVSGAWKIHAGERIYAYGSLLLILAAAVLFYLGWQRLALFLLAAAVLVFALTTYPMASLALLVIGPGAYWLHQRQTRKRAVRASVKLESEGKPAEATAALRVGDEELDAAWRAVKGDK